MPTLPTRRREASRGRSNCPPSWSSFRKTRRSRILRRNSSPATPRNTQHSRVEITVEYGRTDLANIVSFTRSDLCQTGWILMNMKPEDVHYIAVEGGGAGGLLIHPSAIEALEELQVVRTENFKPAGVLGWSGSSSGSIISTLNSVGYTSQEIISSACQEAFDMIFRLEEIRQGDFAAIHGKCKRARTTTPAPSVADVILDSAAPLGWQAGSALAAAISEAIRQSDPAGLVADIAHMLRAVLSAYIEATRGIYDAFL